MSNIEVVCPLTNGGLEKEDCSNHESAKGFTNDDAKLSTRPCEPAFNMR